MVETSRLGERSGLAACVLRRLRREIGGLNLGADVGFLVWRKDAGSFEYVSVNDSRVEGPGEVWLVYRGE